MRLVDSVGILIAELIEYSLYSVVVLTGNQLPNDAFKPAESGQILSHGNLYLVCNSRRKKRRRDKDVDVDKEKAKDLLEGANFALIIELIVQSSLDVCIHD